jgi:hypothetical protein
MKEDLRFFIKDYHPNKILKILLHRATSSPTVPGALERLALLNLEPTQAGYKPQVRFRISKQPTTKPAFAD